jgi:hypothetical protein
MKKMVNVGLLKILGKKYGMTISLHERRNQLTGKGVIWDFDVKGGKINRIKIVDSQGKEGNVNIYFDNSQKINLDFNNEKDLIDYMREYN